MQVDFYEKGLNRCSKCETDNDVIIYLEKELESLEVKYEKLINDKIAVARELRNMKKDYHTLKKQLRYMEDVGEIKVTPLGYKRIAIYDNVDELLANICNCKERKYKLENGHTVKTDSLRYHTFYEKGTECVCCGLKGSFLALEQFMQNKGKTYHLNLYGVDEDGKEILMTKDHIIPKSLGGTDSIDNMQTMCANCNSLKGNDIDF